MKNQSIFQNIFIILFLVGNTVSLLGQDQDSISTGSTATKGSSNLIISGTLFEDGQRLQDVIVTITGGTSKVKEVFSDAGGKFKLEFELDEISMVHFNKAGFVEKTVEVDTRNVPEIERKYDLPYKGWKVDMFPSDLEVDYSSLSKPVAKVVYNPADEGFSTDKKYERTVRPSRERLLKDVYAAYDERDMQVEGAFDDYMLAVKDGDMFLKEQDYENALIQYEAAKDILPSEGYPEKQIKKTMALMQENASEDEQYANYLTAADDAYADKSWEEARVNYESAQGVKPKMEYPGDQIDKIVRNIAAEQIAAAEMAEKEKLDVYNGLVAQADSLLGVKKYSDSKTKYQQALDVLGKEYPKSKINEIEGLLAQSKKSEEAYTSLLANANKFMQDKKYSQAKETYTSALGIKPNADQPKQKLKEIEGLLSGLAAMQALDAKLAAKKESDLQAKYDGLIIAADALMVDKSYVQAKAEYEKAFVLKSGELYPKNQIELINSTLAKEEDIDIEYANLMADAAKNKTSSKWKLAKSNYQAALVLKPNTQEPKAGIAEIDAMLAGMAADVLAKEKGLNDTYDRFVAGGDAMMTLEKYTEAKVEYEKASEIKSEEVYPKNQIDLINSTLAKLEGMDKQYANLMADATKNKTSSKWELAKSNYKAALVLKPNAQEPKAGIAEIDAMLAVLAADLLAQEKVLNDKYDGFIAEGDAMMTSEKYAEAKTEYENALGLKSEEEYPENQIKLINSTLAKRQGINKQYASLMEDANKNKSSSKWELAKSNYEAALVLKPEAQGPKDGIAEIDATLAKMAAVLLAQEKVVNDKYDGMVAKGDAMMTLEKYLEAELAYKEALKVKSNEDYPKSQIAIIQDKLQAIASAAAASEKEAKELAAIELAYSQSIEKADLLFKSGSLTEAKTAYQNALVIQTGKAYPISQISEIETKLTLLAAEKEAKAKEEAALAAKENEYLGFVTKGDASLTANDFVTARLAYQNAQKVFVGRDYPTNQIKKITGLELAAQQKAEQEALALAQSAENEKRFNELVVEGDVLVESQ
ncbi:MAG: hypothetical protein ACI8SA_000678, partial [Dokdonia sp.]